MFLFQLRKVLIRSIKNRKVALCWAETHQRATDLVPLWVQLSNAPPGSTFGFVIIWIIRCLKHKTSARIKLLIQTTFHLIVSSLRRSTLSLLQVPFPFTGLTFRKRILDTNANNSVIKGKVDTYIDVKMRWEVCDWAVMLMLEGIAFASRAYISWFPFLFRPAVV